MEPLELVKTRTADLLFALDYIGQHCGEEAVREVVEEIVNQDPAFWSIWAFVQQNQDI